MLARMTRLISGLRIFEDTMKANLEKMRGLIFSQTVLLALAESGLVREKAYEVVQRCAMQVWEGKGDLKDLLAEDPDIDGHLDRSQLEACFDLGPLLRNVDTIFARAGLAD